MQLQKLLLSEYMPYSKSVIIDRAMCYIDGLKPVQRRILYSMYNLGLGKPEAKTTKSVKIVGDTMGKYHPHGDSSIYGAMVIMSSDFGAFNVPYLSSKGSFGAVYSRDMQPSAPRYTEAKLAPICTEFFDGIKEDAVDMIDNFDRTELEPYMLPVKFPTILVNSSAGIAVGTSSNIPSFSLKNVCLATIGVLKGEIKDAAQLSKVLGAPEFTTGGFLHASDKALENLCKTGAGTFTLSGHVQLYSNQIVIDEIPYNTTAEDIMDEITEHMKSGEIKSIRALYDEIDIKGLKITIELKSGYNSREVLADLCRLTKLRNKISFRTRLIINNRCKELGLLELLDEWIKFRKDCIKRIYTFRYDKAADKEHILKTWELINGKITEIVQMIGSNTEEVAKSKLIKDYGLDNTQAEYLLDMKIRSITNDRARKSLEELAKTRETMQQCKLIVENDNAKVNLIISELEEIITKYGKDNLTHLAPELVNESSKAPDVVVDDAPVAIVLTKEGYLKRLTSIGGLSNKYVSPTGDEEKVRWIEKNNKHLLVFDRFGSIHKILIDDIDSSRGKPTEKLYEKAGLEKPSDLIYADVCGDYSKYFNIIYPNGKGTRVYYSEANPEGKRKVYKAGYSEVQPGQFFLTTEDKFFLISQRNKAAYCDISRLGIISNRTAFKVARLASGEHFVKLQPWKDVPFPHLINLEKYNKDYTVCIKDDMLIYDPEKIEENKRIVRESFKQFADLNHEKTEESNQTEENEQSEDKKETAED